MGCVMFEEIWWIFGYLCLLGLCASGVIKIIAGADFYDSSNKLLSIIP